LKVSENRLLRRIFGPNKDEMVRSWRNLHSEELHNLYPSPNVSRKIMSRKIRWRGDAAHIGRKGMHVELWWESRKERDH
jgi:hypothetical protein